KGRPLTAIAPLEFTFDLVDVRPGEPFKKPEPGLFDGLGSLFNARPKEPGWQRSVLTWENMTATGGPLNVLTVYKSDPALPLKPSEELYEVRRNQSHDAVHCYGFVPREKAGEPLLVVGSEYNLTLHNAETGELLRNFYGHEGIVWTLAVSPDGR